MQMETCTGKMKSSTTYICNPDPEDSKTLKCSDRIPARYVLAFFCFSGVALVYQVRYNMSVTIVAMVNNSAVMAGSEKNDNGSHECHADRKDTALDAPKRDGEFDWSQTMQGVVLGSVYYGYSCTQVLGGRLSEAWMRPKWVFGGSIFVAYIATLLTPLAARISVYALIVVRIISGMAVGTHFPAMLTLLRCWSPTQERSTLLAVCALGANVGSVITLSLSGYLCASNFLGGWPAVFYVFGFVGCVWFVFWSMFIYDHPSEHPRISKREFLYITQNLVEPSKEKAPTIPWKSLLTSYSVWALTGVRFLSAWGYNTIGSKLPAYMEIILHYSTEQNGVINAVVYASQIGTMLSGGFLADLLMRRQCLSTTAVRKLFETIALVVPAACLVVVPHLGCHSTAVVSFFCLAVGCYGFVSGGENPAASDMAPDFAGTIFGFANTAGAIAGFLAPLVAGVFLDRDNGSLQQWTYVFYLSSGLYVLGAVGFLIFGSAELQPWANQSRSQDTTEQCTESQLNVHEKSQGTCNTAE